MVEYHAREASYPAFSELVDDIFNATWKAPSQNGYTGQIRETVDFVALNHLMALAEDQSSAPQPRAIASLKLDELKKWMNTQLQLTKDESRRAELFYGLHLIEQFQKNPETIRIAPFVPPPAGDPIGDGGWQ